MQLDANDTAVKVGEWVVAGIITWQMKQVKFIDKASLALPGVVVGKEVAILAVSLNVDVTPPLLEEVCIICS